MATREGPSVPRKKTTTYGKTSRKRPIHAFLELTNGSSSTSRPSHDEGQRSPAQHSVADTDRDPYDLPDDHPEYPPIPRRVGPQRDAPSTAQSGAAGSFKKRKLPGAVAAKVERKADTKSSASTSQATVASTFRAAKPPLMPTTSTTRVAKPETKPTPKSSAPRTASMLKPPASKTTSAPKPAVERPGSSKQIQAYSSKSHALMEVQLRQKNDDSLQIRQKTPMCSLKPEPRIGQSSTTDIELSPTKPKRPPEPRRVRLIDQLAAQNEDSSEYESDTSEESFEDTDQIGEDDVSLSTPAMPTDAVTPKPSARPKQLLSLRKFKSTYGEQRTLKADDQSGDGLGSQMSMGIDSQYDLSPPPMSKLSSFAFEEEEIDGESSSKGGGIIDIHALRQAGANHRFADSMADLLDRVGTPQPPKTQSSRSRRTALLELASKLRDKTFVRQFRDQGAKDALFRAIGAEEDLVSGFILTSVLLVLFTSYSVPHLVPQLQTEGIAQLASRMFDEDEDLANIACQRKSNLSKNAQASLGVLKSTLQKLDVWKGSPPAKLSPRILALKVLYVLCKDSDGPATWDILAGLTDHLFGFVKKGWETSREQGMGATEGGIALSLLEGYSIAAMQSEAGPRWTKRYLPILADVLTAAMARPMDQFGDFEATTLKLALNTTNNNPSAAGAFSRGELFRELAATSFTAFELLEKSVRKGAFSNEIYEMLMLMLGVMINTSEHCPSTRKSVDSWQQDDASPLDKLIGVYLDNRESAVMADSVEKTSVAVAHGYLAILLGYLCLGKSSLAVQFVDGHFVDSYYPTIENTFSKTIRYKGQEFATEIVDTAGQDEYSILNSKHFIGIHGYMLVYSVSSLPSFEMVQVIREKILNHLGTESVPIVIVGNKSDLRPEQRQVSAEEGKKLSERIQCGWTEASARYNENVSKAFEILIAQIEKAQNPNEAAEGGKCALM
ncbi:hypothetical protein CkaCkLH20_13045 [Colletotrichum karsti]|uniref:Wings apart-like protein C-terminal domain-containing protein n=1 Tax=Colletotrichum karsti TaxID=1095194 RepID=A0A9P6HSB1_9PEZI|nr:uncharacterized protein CkaCkLH20_13045 [Colletotrichum karsti]KAF9869448.1 hypothetical protein CkaCkLH20_13045 [Colletotrichum karsti]